MSRVLWLILLISQQNPHLYKCDIEHIVSAVFGEIIHALALGNRVELRGFGAFSVRQREARKGRNPRTGDTVAVGIRRVPYFKTGKDLHDRLNAHRLKKLD